MAAFSPAPSIDRRGGGRPDWLIPWLFVGGMLLVILVNGALVYFAISSFSGLATNDAYDKGLTFNRTIAAVEAQAARGWRVDVSTRVTGARLDLAAAFRDRAGVPLDGMMVEGYLVRPTSTGHDRAIRLAALGGGRYAAEMALPLRGEWLLTVSARRGDDTWQSTRRVHLQ
ncbi:MAG: FixH family protein [Dongiaceae bacterium]